jgi:hypothetical protein
MRLRERTSSSNPPNQGQPVKFAAVVASTTTTPTATMTFTAGNTQLGTVTLEKGEASVITRVLPTGKTTISATYNGTANIVGSSGSVVEP